jgi:hypothetical protein
MGFILKGNKEEVKGKDMTKDSFLPKRYRNGAK